MCSNRPLNLSFNDVFYEVRIADRTITRITRFYGASQLEQEVTFTDLPREVQLAITDDIASGGSDDSFPL